MKEYIEREAAIEWVSALVDTMSVCTSIDECLGMKSMKSRALGALRDIPAADVVEVRKAKWVATDKYMVDKCSSCQFEKDCKQNCVYYISESPTVDAVPVCRCKDCRWHEDEEPGMVWCPRVIGSWVANNWYCADGERKGGDE